MHTTKEILLRTKAASANLAVADCEKKNQILFSMADSLLEHTQQILQENEKDLEHAKGSISSVMADRLRLTEKRIFDMAEGVRSIAAMKDPVGEILSCEKRPNGLQICKKRVPFGVVAIIYESRPNVTSDAVALALKSGNACILRGGKEAHLSCMAVMQALKEGVKNAGGNPDCINLVEDTGRESATELMTATGLVDLLIPRGGAGLIRACVENATVPCIQTGTGICHVYVDEDADLDMALKILINAKTSRPSVCNAAEVCLVHSSVADRFLPMVKTALVEKREKEGLIPVELRLCETSKKIIDGTLAGKTDFDTEFLDYILAIRVVNSLEEAIEHIALHSTGHSEAIITNNENHANIFTNRVDSAAVYVNASTRFTDGGEFGFGCEMGISTQKLHARGPMGLSELTTYKYIITGNGQIR